MVDSWATARSWSRLCSQSRSWSRRRQAAGGAALGTALVTVLVTVAVAVASAVGPDPLDRQTLAAAAGVAAAGRAPDWTDEPTLFVTSNRPLSDEDVARLRTAVGASRAVAVDYGRLTVGNGMTDAVAGGTEALRSIAPDVTAAVDELWQRIEGGEVAVAHSVATALAVDLGSRVEVRGNAAAATLRIGALATMRLPGVGVVVDRTTGASLGLVQDGAVALVVPGNPDPVVAAAAARQSVPGVRVTSLRVVLTPADPPASPPAGPSSAAVPTSTIPQPEPSAPPPPPPPPAPAPEPEPEPPPVAAAAGWVNPTDGTITRGYNPVTGSARHLGLDIGAPFGTPIRAATAGYVLYAGPASGYGNVIILQHGDGVETVYGHMWVFTVRDGAVQTGQQIAEVGSEGRSTGPHLHFEVKVNDATVDPLAWLRGRGVAI